MAVGIEQLETLHRQPNIGDVVENEWSSEQVNNLCKRLQSTFTPEKQDEYLWQVQVIYGELRSASSPDEYLSALIKSSAYLTSIEASCLNGNRRETERLAETLNTEWVALTEGVAPDKQVEIFQRVPVLEGLPLRVRHTYKLKVLKKMYRIFSPHLEDLNPACVFGW